MSHACLERNSIENADHVQLNATMYSIVAKSDHTLCKQNSKTIATETVLYKVANFPKCRDKVSQLLWQLNLGINIDKPANSIDIEEETLTDLFKKSIDLLEKFIDLLGLCGKSPNNLMNPTNFAAIDMLKMSKNWLVCGQYRYLALLISLNEAFTLISNGNKCGQLKCRYSFSSII